MHSIVFAEHGTYAGWPANHGAWQWGDEFLVGFMRGAYRFQQVHSIDEPYQRVLARSMDGGETWTVELPNLEFTNPAPTPELSPTDLKIGYTRPGIIRVCGSYDHGGDYEDLGGGFFYSEDRGHTWTGPFGFRGLEKHFAGDANDMMCTSRTRVIGNKLFLTRAYRGFWGTDETFVAEWEDGQFKFVSTVCADDSRAVMPAAICCGGHYVVCIRRRQGRKRAGWIDCFRSFDLGETWEFASMVGQTGGHNGNPPALAMTPHAERLICCFGNRDEGSIVVARSDNFGLTWKSEALRRYESESSYARADIGYPQLFTRDDGKMVCVYYWTSPEHPHQHIAATTFDP